MYRIAFSSVYGAPAGQQNGRLLLLPAAIQPVHRLRSDICLASFLILCFSLSMHLIEINIATENLYSCYCLNENSNLLHNVTTVFVVDT